MRAVSFGEAPAYLNSPQAGSYGNMRRIATEQYIPVMDKRELEKPEEKGTHKKLQQWWPEIGANYGTPLENMLASPQKSAIISGLGTGLFTAAVGALALMSKKYSPIAAIIAGLVGTVFGTIVGYINRRRENGNILDTMRRLPPGATLRDRLSDPAYQSELNRRATMSAGNNGTGDLINGVFLASMLNSRRSR